MGFSGVTFEKMILIALLATVPLAVVNARTVSCPDGWYLDTKLENCYQVITQPGGFNFDTANAKCKGLGGQLASVHSAAENELISTLSNQAKPTGNFQTLIGAQRSGPKPKNWKWSDGSKWDYTNWSPKNPDNNGGAGGQDCVQVFSSIWGPSTPDYYRPQQWDDLECSAAYQNAICKKSAVNPCDEGWSFFNNFCYKAVNQTGGLTFDQGDKMCKDQKAQLTSVHSVDENAFIAQVANTNSPQSATQTLIGAKRTGPKPENWKWSDGTKWDFNAWSTGNPDNAAGGGGQDCIQAFSSPYGPNPPVWYTQTKWDDRDCKQFVNAVCKKVAPKKK